MALIEAMASCLRDITIANGFNTDAGQWVTTEPAQVDDEAVGVLAVVWERQSKPANPAVQKSHRGTTVAIVGKLPHEQDEKQYTIDLLIDDIERALDGQQQRFPERTSYPQWVETLPIPAEQGMGWVGVLMRYESDVPTSRRAH